MVQSEEWEFTYDDRPHEAPDLRYVDDSQLLNIEITDAYYDEDDAKMQWKMARKKDDAPDHWSGGILTERSCRISARA